MSNRQEMTATCRACLAQEFGFVMGIKVFFIKSVAYPLCASEMRGNEEAQGTQQGGSGSVTRRTVWGLKRVGPNSGSDTS